MVLMVNSVFASVYWLVSIGNVHFVNVIAELKRNLSFNCMYGKSYRITDF